MSRPRRKRKKNPREIYPIERSPLAQKITTRGLASLLKTTVNDLRREVNYKELAIVRRTEIVRKGKRAKKRDFVYPEHSSSLYLVHKTLAEWLNRIQQPDYVFSPRAGKTTKSNATHHAGQKAFLQIDIKKFYPSTTKEMVRDGLINAFGMYRDVANLIANIVTIDDKASFGSPVTPVLMTIVFREMFDLIYAECKKLGLRMSIWVDDITISGNHITPGFIEKIRGIVREYGHKTHKIKTRSSGEGICITGIWLYGRNVEADFSYELRLRESLEELKKTETPHEYEQVSRAVLSAAGSIRYIVGPSSKRGQEVSNLAGNIRLSRKRQQEEATKTAISADKHLEVAPDTKDIPF